VSRLTIVREEFPQAVPGAACVGDVLTFVVTGTVRRIESDLVDVQSYGGGPEYLLGAIDVELQLTEITVLADVADAPKRRGLTQTPEWQAIHDPIILRWARGEITRAEAIRIGQASAMPEPCSESSYTTRRALLEGASVSADGYPRSNERRK